MHTLTLALIQSSQSPSPPGSAPIELWLPILISMVSLFLSLVGSAFIAGSKWGKMTTALNDIDKRMARIEGMFELKLKE